MQIDMITVNNVNAGLTEMAAIVIGRQMDKDIVLKKLNEIIENLYKLNTSQQESLAELQTNEQKWKDQITGFNKSLASINDNAEQIKSLVARLPGSSDNERIQFLKKIDEINGGVKSHGPNLKFDLSLLSTLLASNMSIQFSKLRKELLWKNRRIFRNINILSKLLTLLISFTIGFIIETIVHVFFRLAPDYIVGLLVTILTYFTVDKKIESTMSTFFWNQVTKEMLILIDQFKIYAEQTEAINNFILETK